MLKVKCIKCNKECLKYPSRVMYSKKNLFCSKTCSLTFNKINGFKKGTRISVGRKVSQETRKKLSLINKGKKVVISKEHREKISNTLKGRKGRKHTIETRLKMSESKKGEKSYLWRGGITNENAKIRQSLEYKLWRTSVFERDNYTCVWCGVKSCKGKSVILNADHIKPFAHYPELRFAIDNGRTLCIDCHKTTDNYGGKSKSKK